MDELDAAFAALADPTSLQTEWRDRAVFRRPEAALLYLSCQ
jgi:hypothetical protein